VETAVNGPLMSPAVIRRQPADCCSRILDWLIDLQQASLRTGDGTWFANIVEDPLRYFAETFPVREDEAAMIARTRDIVAPLRNAGLPFVCEHGDLSHPNLILRGRGVGIIDWELAQMDGLVAYDLFIFLSYVAVSLRRANSTDARLDAFHDAFFSAGAWTLPLVRSYAIRLHLPADALAPLFVWSWARYTINLLRRITDGDSPPGSRVERATADSLRSHRYYRMWRHAVTNVHRLSWGG
jgi:hypothetical protein